ncbi:hypothetical protein LZ198_04580 [Myxococcus sp. K15C18031901]|uniref:hypothetical protein n=1 Tax=Myxococcus dinghuensis TaxID=2906761 RepID=UPI0020A7FC1A|nr:hypothetical protein [Myxococcus dinghuensis]MCP3098152.1 hypothetical protein [Myxococcus dinghuensis]
MKVRDLAIQGGLAAFALVAAYAVWQREPVGAPTDVTVVDAPSRALDVVRYEDDARYVELFRDAKDRDKLWVRLGFKPSKPVGGEPVADGGTPPVGDAGTPAVAAVQTPPPPPRELRANEVAEKLLPKFGPLRAMRALGVLDAKKLEEVGLASTPRKLTLTLAGKPEAFSLASTTGSWGTPYLRRESDGQVFLLGPALLPDLENANTRLVDRRLHVFDLGDFDSVVVSSAGVTRTFVATGKAPGPVALAPEEAPDKSDEFARNWHDRVWRLIPLDLLGRDELPAGGQPKESFRVEYRRAGKVVGEVVVARAEDGFFARTEHTSGWARLHAGVDPLVTEAARVTSPVSSATGP